MRENEVVAIDWSTSNSKQFFDHRNKLVLFVEFRDSLKEDYKMIKFLNFLYMQEEHEDDNPFGNRVVPSNIRLSTMD